ncbi:MAG: hypothetical protein AABX30_00090 [Nanoarchaeota archaeon]
MLLKETSQRVRAIILIEFTKELIRNSKTAETIAIEKLLREKIKESLEARRRQKQLYEIMDNRYFSPEEQNRNLGFLNFQKQRMRKIYPQRVIIKTPSLPYTVSNITPQPTPFQIDLGKLNQIIKDASVSVIECNGPEKNLTVKQGSKAKTTSIQLTSEEISQIIEIFAQEAKIPIEEGVFKVAVGNLTLTAIISEAVSPKFTIEKSFI